MKNENLSVEDKFDGAIREIKLNIPPANVLTAAVMTDMVREMEKASAIKGLKALVFSSEGAHFSYGAKVDEHLPAQVGAMLPQFHRFIERILDFPVPTFSRVTGLCLGGAFEMVMATEFIFCDETVSFAVPEIQLGVFPPVACALLPELLPGTLANRMILTGQKVSASVLKACEFVT